ncbi:adenosylcobinamide-phosphate synthase [Stella humosa]|uniref:Cobalamin biosynthesis protein CobD n=1 Tax=Stella humosa TaxID=94 RepID=A0A3N1LHK2_9PROT|nr:adenosylcobinamide-phosphate synthase CbiB [Stella humosa]ROP90730.1 adenosylcobinamide-phosphate synthase [Stella humosa]BBK29370.1 cobalamin biosynthesis protein CobD [Stella humosa]
MLLADPGSVAPLVHLFLALLLDAAVGDPPLLWRLVPHPVVLCGRLITFFDRRLNRPERSEMARRLRGCFTVLAVVLAAGAVGAVLAWIAGRLRAGPAIEVLAIAILVSQRSLFDHVAAVATALDQGGTEAGRAAVAHIVGRSPESLDEHGVARAAIESLAENFSDGVAAPVFWTLLFGLPGLFVYKAVNTMDSMIGHRTPQYRAFGWAAARLDDVLNLVPARLAGLLVAAAAAVTPAARPGSALVTMVRDAGKHRSPNAGWPEAAMAGALGLALCGPRRYPGLVVDAPWIGQGRARADSGDIGRALMVYVRACALLIGAIGLAAVILWWRR